MSWLNAISTANRETRGVEADNRKRESEIRNLQRMRQQDWDASAERDRQARGKASAQQDIPDFVDLPSGGMWGMNAPATPQAPATTPAPTPGIEVNPMKASRYREANKPTGAAPDQSMAESSRLARQAPPQKPGKLATSGYDAQSVAMAQRADEPSRATANRGAQQRRLSELVRKNPTTDTRRGESTAESARLLRQPVPAPAQGGATSAQEAFIAQYAEAAKRAGAQTGIDPKVLLSQWGLETGWGKSIVPGTNNLGNIKDFRGSGATATDNMTGSVDKYRQFGSADEFADHYAGLVQRKYPGAIGAGSDMGKFAGAMKAGGYAEDPAYGAKLQQIHSRMGAQAPAATPGIPVQQTTQVAQAPAVNAVRDAAPVGEAPTTAPQPAQGQQVGRDTIAGLSPEDDQSLRILRMQHAELVRRLPTATMAEAQAIRDKLVGIVSGAQDIQVRNAATQAIENDQALTSLARAAGIPFTQTPEGFVLVKPDGQGNWRAASPPVDRMALITHVTGVLTGSLAARAAEDRKAQYGMQEKVAVEREKGVNEMRKIAATHQTGLQTALFENGLKEKDVLEVGKDMNGQPTFVRTTRGLFTYTPGGVGELEGPSKLTAVSMQ